MFDDTNHFLMIEVVCEALGLDPRTMETSRLVELQSVLETFAEEKYREGYLECKEIGNV